MIAFTGDRGYNMTNIHYIKALHINWIDKNVKQNEYNWEVQQEQQQKSVTNWNRSYHGATKK